MKIFGIVGWKNSGKTTLVERLVSEIAAQGFSVSTVKHAHHSFDVDQPGKDSHRHRVAGAREVMLTSSGRWALMHELRGADEPTLPQLLQRLSSVDLVLVEGFKSGEHAKIEVRRENITQDPIAMIEKNVRAFAAKGSVPNLGLPVFDLDDTKAIARFILKEAGLK